MDAPDDCDCFLVLDDGSHTEARSFVTEVAQDEPVVEEYVPLHSLVELCAESGAPNRLGTWASPVTANATSVYHVFDHPYCP